MNPHVEEEYVPHTPRATNPQKLHLLAYMEANGQFGKGEAFCGLDHETFLDRWTTLTEHLNVLPGGTRKNVAQWQKVCVTDSCICKL